MSKIKVNIKKGKEDELIKHITGLIGFDDTISEYCNVNTCKYHECGTCTILKKKLKLEYYTEEESSFQRCEECINMFEED